MNLIHMRGRVYDPTIGIFLTPDPYIQDPGSVLNLNRYSYVLNNPLRYTDPSGHFFKEVSRGFRSAGKALMNPGRFLSKSWNKLNRSVSDPRYQRLVTSIAISVAATVKCPFGAEAAWYQTAGYYAAVGATSSYVASNGDAKAALNGAFTGAAFNMVGTYFDHLKASQQLSGNSFISAKIAAHGMVGGLSSVHQGGSFESGFLSSGLSQAAAQFGVYENLGASESALGWGIGYNAAVSAVVGGGISSAAGGGFEQGALNAAMGRLFNDMSHVMTFSPALGGMAALDGPLPIGDIAAVGAGVALWVYGDDAAKWLQSQGSVLFSDGDMTTNESAQGIKAQAPGIPTEDDGFKPAKKWDGETKVKAENGRGYGYPAKDGSVWVPTGTKPSIAHGGPHWDVQLPNGKHKNVYPGGKVR